MMCVRLERNVGGCVERSGACLLQGQSFSVFQAVESIETLPANLTITIDDYTADQRSRADLTNSLGSQVERAGHHPSVRLAPICDRFSFYGCCFLQWIKQTNR